MIALVIWVIGLSYANAQINRKSHYSQNVIKEETV
jgi:hypothetical protein